jgi:predicted MFS family arabinose efflux permease
MSGENPFAPPAAAPAAPDRRRERLLVALLTSVQFTSITDFVVMLPLGPQLMHVFHTGPQGFGSLVAAYNISAGISALFASRVLDRFDRKRALIVLYIGFIIGTAACATASSYYALMAARVAAGACSGVLGAVVMAIIGDQIPYERRGAAMGAVMTAFSLASVVGVPIGLWAASVWSWHAAFVVVALVSLPPLALAMSALPPMRGHLARDGAPRVPLLRFYRELLGNRSHLAALGLTVTLTFAGFSVIPFMAPYMSTNVGLKDGQLGYIYLVGGAATIATARFIGRLADIHGKHRVFAWVALLSLIPVLIVTRLPPLPLAAALTASTVFMILVSGRYIPASTMVTAAVSSERRGAFMSLNSAVQALVCGIATSISGAIIVRDGDGPMRHYEIVGLISCVSTLLAIALARRIKPRRTEVTAAA